MAFVGISIKREYKNCVFVPITIKTTSKMMRPFYSEYLSQFVDKPLTGIRHSGKSSILDY